MLYNRSKLDVVFLQQRSNQTSNNVAPGLVDSPINVCSHVPDNGGLFGNSGLQLFPVSLHNT